MNDDTPALFWRLPGIRHARYRWHLYWINRHYEMWGHVGALPLNADQDYAVLDAIWRGDR